MNEVSNDIQLAILTQDRQIYVNTRFQLQARMKAVQGLIAKKILTEDDKKPILDELTKIEAWIDEYDAQIEELKQSAPAENPTISEPTNGHVKENINA